MKIKKYLSKFRHLPKFKKRTVCIPLILLLLLAGTILILPQFESFQQVTNQAVSEPNLASSTFIVDTLVSSASQVESKIIAEKLDLERKLIVPKSASQVDKIHSVINNSGGNVIRSKPNLIVAMLPKETEENIKKELDAEKAINSLEVDYPTFLATDTPDWGVTKIEAPAVWVTTQASGIKIAVIDTGIDYTHPELLPLK